MDYAIFLSFINKYGENNPDMLQQLREATRLKVQQPTILEKMASYAKKYCPDKHILELLFDLSKNMGCEELIRVGVGKEGAQNYSMYIQEISGPFQKLVQTEWNQIAAILTKLKLDTDTLPSHKPSFHGKHWSKHHPIHPNKHLGGIHVHSSPTNPNQSLAIIAVKQPYRTKQIQMHPTK